MNDSVGDRCESDGNPGELVRLAANQSIPFPVVGSPSETEHQPQAKGAVDEDEHAVDLTNAEPMRGGRTVDEDDQPLRALQEMRDEIRELDARIDSRISQLARDIDQSVSLAHSGIRVLIEKFEDEGRSRDDELRTLIRKLDDEIMRQRAENSRKEELLRTELRQNPVMINNGEMPPMVRRDLDVLKESPEGLLIGPRAVGSGWRQTVQEAALPLGIGLGLALLAGLTLILLFRPN